jgi:two-component system, NarL family, response regulator NreC
MPTRIVLADDHSIVRHGLRLLLETEPDFIVVAEARDGPSALRMVEQWQPDILVVDIVMPGLSGLEVARQVSRRSAGTRVIVLSMYAAEAYVLEALRAGIVGYVLKEATIHELVTAVRTVARGQRYLSPPLSERAIDAYVERASSLTPAEPYSQLTPREREVFQLAAEGHSNTAIAERLSISPRTAEVHRARFMRKLGLANQTDVVRYALRLGILPDPA